MAGLAKDTDLELSVFLWNRYCCFLQQRTKVIFFPPPFFNDVMRGSNLLVAVQIRGMIKEEEKRNRSPPVLIFGRKKTRESICERKARRERKNREAQQNQGELESRGGGFRTKRLSFSYERKEKKRAKEKLLLACWTQCQSQSASGLAAPLVSQAPAHNGGDPGPPHLSLPICVLQDGTGSEGPRAGMTMLSKKYLNSYYIKKRNSTWRELD